MIYVIVLLLISAIAWACMDTVAHHYEKSIFSKIKISRFDEYYFNNSISWLNKYKKRIYNENMPYDNRKRMLWGIMDYPAFLTDFWHLCKSIIICSFLGAIVMYKYCNLEMQIFDFIAYGIIWNMTFSLFYNKILIKKH